MENPFVGPRPIPKDKPIFGRDRDIAALRHLLISERFVLLHSPSGTGKTSLLVAGLIPELKQRFDVWPLTRVHSLPPHGLNTNRYVWSVIDGWQLPGRPVNLAACLPEARGPNPILLLFDQFEEILRASPTDTESRAEFFRQLAALLAHAHVWALFALRDDYLAALLPHCTQLPTQLRTRYRLEPLTRLQARDVMSCTALEGGRTFTPRALDALTLSMASVIVQNPDGTRNPEPVLSDAIEPLLLQIVCRRLWDGMPPGDLTIDPEDAEQFGDVNEALASYYRVSVESAAAGDFLCQRSIRHFFETELITPTRMRGQVQLCPEVTAGLPNAIIDRLLETHLIRSENRRGSFWLELAHDSLIRPVLNDNARWNNESLNETQRRAALWLSQNRLDALLVIGEDLRMALQWASDNPALLTAVEKDFLAESQVRQEQLDREAAYVQSLRTALARVQMQESSRANAACRQEESLAHYVAALRINPASTIEARTAIASHLQYLPFAIPVSTSFRQSDGAIGAISDDGHRLAVLSLETASIEIFDSFSGAVLSTHSGYSPDAALALNADGSLLLIANPDGTVQFLSTAADSANGPPAPTGPRPSAAAFNHSGNVAFTLSAKGILQLWYSASGHPAGPPRHAETPFCSAAFLPGTPNVLTVATGGAIQVWDDSPAGLLSQRPSYPGNVTRASFSDAFLLGDDPLAPALMIDAASSASLWSPSAAVPTSLSAPAPITQALLSPSGSYALLLSDSSQVTLWDIPTLSQVSQPLLRAGYDRRISLSRSGRLFAMDLSNTGSYGGDPHSRADRLQDIVSVPHPVDVVPPPPERLPPAGADAVATSPNGRLTAIAAANDVRIYNSATGDILSAFSVESAPSHLVFSPGEDLLLTVGATSFRLWSSVNGEPAGDPVDVGSHLLQLTFSPDGQSILAVSYGYTPSASVWSLSGERRLETPPMECALQFGAWSPACDQFLTVSGPTIDLWDARTGERLGAPISVAGKSDISAAAFSPEGRRLVVGANCGTVQLFETSGCEPISPPFRHLSPVVSAAFSPDGGSVLATREDGSSLCYRVLLDDGSPGQIALLSAVAEAVAGVTVGDRGFLRPLDNLPERRAALRTQAGSLAGPLPAFLATFLPEELTP